MEKTAENSQLVVEGMPASPGIARGPLRPYRRSSPGVSVKRISAEEVGEHLERWRKAAGRVEGELREMKEREEDPETAAILEAQVQVVRDPDLEAGVEEEIRQRRSSAGLAIRRVFGEYLEKMEHRLDDGDRNPAVDLADIRDRLIALAGDDEEEYHVEEGSVVVARELSAREVIRLSGSKIRGLVTERGGATSHAAIIARSMGIPTVMGTQSLYGEAGEGVTAIVDGTRGRVIVNPGEPELEEFRRRSAELEKRRERRARLCRKPSRTADGKAFTLRANVEFPEELEKVRLYCAEGIGLLRTESVYLERSHFDDLQKQEEFYGRMLEGTGDHPVTIRLFDAGGDKFLNLGEPDGNPFLGWRGIRLLLDERELLRDQLRAILRTAGRWPGRTRVLIPMVARPGEVEEVREELETLNRRLAGEGEKTDPDVALGIMVEVPSVALQAERYAGMVDFMSMGTNDLTQYLMAVDRGNERVSRLYDQRHPAVWELIRRCAEAARREEIGISVCGELASDPVSAACLLGMGVEELSMSPARIPEVKELLMSRTQESMENLARQALQAGTPEEIDTLFNNWKNES